MLTEIIIYKLKESMSDAFWEAFINKSLPAMKKGKINISDYGFSLEDPLIFHLIRTFNSLEDRNTLLNEFYNSEDWKKGAREDIMKSIESYKTTTFKK